MMSPNSHRRDDSADTSFESAARLLTILPLYTFPIMYIANPNIGALRREWDRCRSRGLAAGNGEMTEILWNSFDFTF